MTPLSSPAYLNGAFTTVGECRISVLDRGFLFGDAVYEVVPVYDGRMFEWPAHFERLESSLRETGIAPPHSSSEWEEILGILLESAQSAEAGAEVSLYLQVSRGVAPRDHAIDERLAPTVFAMVMPLSPGSSALLEKGVSVITAEDVRWSRCDVKTTSLIANVLSKASAVGAGAYDVIFLRDGRVTESSAANVFIVRNGALATPPKDRWILAGITRGVLIRLAAQRGVEVQERVITGDELKLADEIWLSSSTKEIVPVTRLDGQPVGSGAPGAVWRTFRGCLKSLV